jgi:tRNA threonylcarbamoyladenosine biosynthesis protein TsaB
MKLLAIDSSTEACSVALLNDDELTEQYSLTPKEHTQRLLPMVDEVLSDSGCSLSQLDAIAFGRGPGSFTGLRICLGVVQGLAFGADVPVVPISSLTALAQTALDKQCVTADETVLAALDARMDELYWRVCRFENGLAVTIGDEHLSPPEHVVLPDKIETVIGVGNGWQYHSRIHGREQFSRFDDSVLPAASAVARLAARAFMAGQYCRADQALPVYLRDDVAWQKTNQQ